MTCRRCGATGETNSNNWCKGCARQQMRDWRAANAERELETRWQRLYGIEPDHFDHQQGLCAFCEEPLGEDTHVDHDHENGTARGLTHPTCNKHFIGAHTLETAERLVEYLRAHTAAFV